jgi:hypothetical protein
MEQRLNHKRGKPKKARAGCLLCKPHKCNHADRRTLPEKRQDIADASEIVTWDSLSQVPRTRRGTVSVKLKKVMTADEAIPPGKCPDCKGTGQCSDCPHRVCIVCGGTGDYE